MYGRYNSLHYLIKTELIYKIAEDTNDVHEVVNII